MSRHDPALRLRHMLDYAREVAGLAEGRTRDDLDTNRLLQLALTRLVEVIGEAAAGVREPTRSQCPEIPWTQIVGMRNRLIHGYDVIDVDMLWNTITSDISPLISLLEAALAELDE